MSAGQRIDGRDVRSGLRIDTDVVIVGSGPAGSAAAAELASLGLQVVVVESGRWWDVDEFRPGTFGAMSDTYREMGASMVIGGAPIPYVQGRMVGGSSPINGAICWRLPQDVHDRWIGADPALADALPWEVLERVTDQIDERLNVLPTDDAVAGAKNLLMARGADALELEHRPIRRNVGGCRGLGRCLQGCPEGNKLSVDRTLLADAEACGAVVVSSAEVQSILMSRGRAVGVLGRTDGGGAVRVMASRAVVIAASAIQTPALLLANGITQGPVGRHFQAHPGVSMTGRFPEAVRMWEGASQGHEVTGLRHEGLKFEVLGMGVDLLAARVGGIGSDMARHIDDLAHHADWGAAVNAEAHGRVQLVRGRAILRFKPTPNDVRRFRRGLRVMGEMMLAAGADYVDPGVHGFDRSVSDPRRLNELEENGPSSAAAFTSAITHMFGTARMGSDPATSVVGPDFQHHNVAGLYVADSSVFPTNLGVNPQIPIMAMATLCARRVAGIEVDRQPVVDIRGPQLFTEDHQ